MFHKIFLVIYALDYGSYIFPYMVNLRKMKAQNHAFQIIPKDIFTQSARFFPKLMLKIINNNENEKMLTYFTI